MSNGMCVCMGVSPQFQDKPGGPLPETNILTYQHSAMQTNNYSGTEKYAYFC